MFADCDKSYHKHLCTVFFPPTISLLLGKYLGSGLPAGSYGNHIFNFIKIAKLFVCLFVFSSSCYVPLPALGIITYLSSAVLISIVVSHCGFNLHLHIILSMFLCANLPSTAVF